MERSTILYLVLYEEVIYVKIVLAYNWSIIGTKGGTEKVLCNMANSMEERGHEVYILCYENTKGEPFFLLNKKVKFKNLYDSKKEKLKNIKIKIQNLTIFSKEKRRLNRKIKNLRFLGKQFEQEIKSVNPDVVLAFSKEICYALVEKLCKNIPIVFTYHFDPDTILGDSFYHDAISSVDCIQVLMPGDIEKTKSYIVPKHRIVHIPNAVPQYEKIIDYNNKIIINVARIHKHQKQQHYLIEAFGRLSSKYSDWKLELWGEKFEPGYVQELQNIISKYKIEKKVFFKGTTDNIPEKLENASIFGFPSSYEGFPLALTEAMSMGLPVLAFNDCPAVNELVVDGCNGLLVEQNIEAFTDGLEKLMSNADLRCKLGQRAKEDMKAYEPNIIWDSWEKLLIDLTCEK